MKLTDYLAVYGAGLSTLMAVWNYARSRPQIRVRLIAALETIDSEVQHGVGISVQNRSPQTVHISGVSILYPLQTPTLREKLADIVRNRRLPRSVGWCHCNLVFYGVQHGCPASIESGKAHYIFVRHDVLEAILRNAQGRWFKAMVQDPLWRSYYSSPFDYPVQAK